jgi:hypothetical protein
MKELIRASALALGVWAAVGPAAAESYLLYDNFQAASLDPARWLDSERSRTVTGTSLRLAQRDWGSAASDSGNSFFSWSENLARGGPVTQLRASMRINAIDMTACVANASPSFARGRIMGTFFNTGNRSAGSNVGDVFAHMQAVRFSNSADPAGVLQVQGQVYVCTSSDCNASTQIGTTASLGTVAVNTWIALQIEWDRANKQFVFIRDKGAQTASVSYAGLDDSADPGSVFKSVGTRTNPANCASGPRPYAFVDARFDNVHVNTAAKP